MTTDIRAPRTTRPPTRRPRARPPAPPPAAFPSREPKKSWAVLAVALTAQILVVLDISVVNTALPTIGRSLHLDGGQLQWLVTAYLMMSGGGLLLGGRVADLLSRRKVFLTGLTLFTIASLVSGFAGNATELIAARAAQGLSAALLTPSALSSVMTTYDGDQRKKGLALWGAVGSLGVAVGVLVGGALTTWTSWQLIFWINGPIGARRPAGRPEGHREGHRRCSGEAHPVRPARGRHRPRRSGRPGLRASAPPHARLVVRPDRAARSASPASCWSRSSPWRRGPPSRCSRRTSGSSTRSCPPPP